MKYSLILKSLLLDQYDTLLSEHMTNLYFTEYCRFKSILFCFQIHKVKRSLSRVSNLFDQIKVNYRFYKEIQLFRLFFFSGEDFGFVLYCFLIFSSVFFFFCKTNDQKMFVKLMISQSGQFRNSNDSQGVITVSISFKMYYMSRGELDLSGKPKRETEKVLKASKNSPLQVMKKSFTRTLGEQRLARSRSLTERNQYLAYDLNLDVFI